jgi:uncharacterized membrane protein
MIDKRYRSFFKALSWRITGTIDTFIISFLVTGKFKFAITISGVEVFTKIFLFYFHERLWNRISFGRHKPEAIIEYTRNPLDVPKDI